ncbi:MAG: hypothetical protein ABWY93_27470 [Mycobacterium sp.]
MSLGGSMEIVLGVSMTPTAIRMVAVEGDKADGVIVDHDVFDVGSADGATTSDATDHVVAALEGTRQSAQAGGHTLLSTGITCSEHHDAVVLRDALTARDFVDVTIVSEEVAAAALAQAAGSVVGDERTALLMIGPGTATLSVVQTDDGAVLDVRSQSRRSSDDTTLADLVGSLDRQEPPPGSLFLICPDSDVAALTAEVAQATSLPISAPEHAGLALARGAALASTHPSAEMLTMGLAYSLDTDRWVGTVLAGDTEAAPRARKPFLLVGSAVSVFVLGVAALIISVAVSVRLTSDQHASAAPPPAAAPPVQHAAPEVPKAVPASPPPPPSPAPPRPSSAPAPIPVVQHKTSAPVHRTQVAKPAPAPVAVTPVPAAPAPPPPPVADPPVAPVPAAPPPPPQVPPILQRIFPFLRTPRYEQPAPYPGAPYQQYPGPGYGGGYNGGYPSYPSYPSY